MKEDVPADPASDVRLPHAEDEEPEVYAVRRAGSGWTLSRRDLAGAAAATVAGGSCTPALAQDCRTTYAHSSEVTALAITPDGGTLISAGADYRLRFWRLPEGTLSRTSGGSWGCNALLVSPDGSTLVTGGQLGLRSISTGSLVKDLKVFADVIAVTPDWRTLVSGQYGGIEIWSLPEGLRVRRVSERVDSVRALVSSPDGELLMGAGSSGSIRLWSLPEGRFLRTIGEHASSVNALAISKEGRFVISAGDDGLVKVWRLPGGVLEKTLSGHRERVNCLALGSDGDLLVTGSDDDTIRVWSLSRGATLATMDTKWDVGALAFSPKGSILVSGSQRGFIQLWSIPQGEMRACLKDPSICSCVGHCSCVAAIHYWYPT